MTAGVEAGSSIDVVAVARIARMIDKHGPRFLVRWFTAEEIAYCSATAEPHRHLAARLAAKGAVFKALHVADAGPVPWRQIEIAADDAGAPAVRLTGRLAEAAARAGRGPVRLAMTHGEQFATAVASVDEP